MRIHFWCLLVGVWVIGCSGEAAPMPFTQEDRSASGDESETQDGAEPLASSELYRLRNLGRLHASRGTPEGFERSYEQFQRVVEQSPADLRDRLNLVRALVFSSLDPEPVLVHLTAARKLAPDTGSADIEYLQGLTHKRLGNLAKAVRAFVAATQLRADIANLWFQRGYAEELADQVDAARKSLTQAIVLDADHRGALFRLGTLEFRAGNDEKGEELIARFESLPETELDYEKCELTEVMLRGIARARVEPPEARLNWRDDSERWFDARTSYRELVHADLDSDGKPDLIVVGDRRLDCLHNTPQGFRPRALYTEGDGQLLGCAVADIDNDGHLDLMLCRKSGLALWVGPQEKGAGVLVALDGATRNSVMLLDIDHDGDVDVLDSAGAVSRNNGDRSFTELETSPFPGVAASATEGGFDAHDLDQANDLDVVFPGPTGARVFLNLRDGTFRSVLLSDFAGMTRILVEDLDGDGAPDIFGCGEREYRWAINRDRRGVRRKARFAPAQRATSTAVKQIRDAELADIDNDGDLDVLLATDVGLVVLRNRAGGAFTEEPPVEVGGSGVERLTAVDLDGDCVLEVVLIANQKLFVLTSNPKPRYEGWHVSPEGKKDNRDAIGTVVEQFCGPLYQSRMIRESGGVHFGLGSGGLAGIDGLRLRWPQGGIQPVSGDELELVGCTTEFPQKEFIRTSCPFLYTRNAEGWHFVTDVVGIAPLGEWMPPGQEAHLDPEEFVRIPGELLSEIDGKLHLAITEELKEVTYLDRVELLAVDHPATRVVYADESTRQGAYDPLTLFVCAEEHLRAPARVTARDANAGELTTARDGRYLHPYVPGPSQWIGWVEPHALELELAAPASHLLLTGRIAWYDSTVAYSLAQHGRTWSPLRLEHLDADGGRVLVEDIGLPAGMDRTVVTPFADAPLPAGSRLRVAGQYQVLWDRIRLASGVERMVIRDGQERATAGNVTLRIHRRPVQRAVLGYHGYSRADGNEARHEQTYAYSDTAPKEPWRRARGRATRYGDITALLTRHDDFTAVFVSGDRVEIEFDAPPSPRLGLRRTWFLRIAGWAKETGYHVTTGETIEPFPLRDMKRFPPTASERRTDAEYRAYLREYQTRRIDR